MAEMTPSPYVFVTVGSTSFDDLVRHVDSPVVLQSLHRQGFKHIIYQIGRGTYVPTTSPDTPDTPDTTTTEEGIKVSYFRSKPTIAPYIKDAALVICHAGVGTVMETLRMKKQVVVVVNPSLMDNHQLEVAAALEVDNHVHLCRDPHLIEQTVQGITKKPQLAPIQELDTSLFPAVLESELLRSTSLRTAHASFSFAHYMTFAIVVVGFSLYLSS
jgi:beta-1,4-N-acetylglucosaminyltransferase